MKIYDCFTFYNELDLLDLRIELLDPYVEHFVIVEATKTFQNNSKPLYFQNNQERYAKYAKKIIHIVVDDMPGGNPWDNERHQRNAIMRGLVDADPNDVAIISDIDEFLRGTSINQIRISDNNIFAFRMPYFNFKFNYMLIGNGESYNVWSVGSRIGKLTSPEDLRRNRAYYSQLDHHYRDQDLMLLEHSGWHFTYLGNNDFIRNKIRSFSHDELNRQEILDAIDVDASIASGRGFNPTDTRQFIPVALDDYFPSNISRLDSFVIPNARPRATTYLSPNTTNNDLVSLANVLPTDKERAHRYVSNFYVNALAKYKTKPVTLFEIGIWNGGSLVMWHDYFPEGKIIGSDITDERMEPWIKDLTRGKVYIEDAYTEQFRDSLPDLDIVIDDGPHTEDSQLRCLELYLSKLKSGGMLIIEDILDANSVEKFKQAVPAGYTYQVHDIRPVSNLPESILFVVERT